MLEQIDEVSKTFGTSAYLEMNWVAYRNRQD